MMLTVCTEHHSHQNVAISSHFPRVLVLRMQAFLAC